MPQQKGKHTFDSEARTEGGSLVTTIPKPVAEYLQLEDGDEINWQTEYSEKIADREKRKNGDYSSIWNETKQRSDKE